jgi:tetratricopeptide (TPR) repeat protein
MIRRHSPLVASEEAKRILRDLGIISQVSPNILLIKNKVEERSRSPIYSDTEDPEEKFIEIAPGVIHELIEKGVINENKIDLAMKKLGEVFSPTIATYYGVLLLITSYVLEELEKKNLIAGFSLIYKQIDIISTIDLKKLLVMFDQNAEKAIDNLKRTIKTLSEIGDKEELSRAKNKLAMLYSYVGQMERAEKELKEAIELNPSFAEAYVNRGNTYASLKQFERAIADFDRAIELNPSFAEAYVNRGNTYASLKQFERAIADFDRAIELNPSFAEAYVNRGNTYASLKQFERAIADFDRAIELNPFLAQAYKNRGNVYSVSGETEKAIRDHNRALELETEIPD